MFLPICFAAFTDFSVVAALVREGNFELNMGVVFVHVVLLLPSDTRARVHKDSKCPPFHHVKPQLGPKHITPTSRSRRLQGIPVTEEAPKQLAENKQVNPSKGKCLTSGKGIGKQINFNRAPSSPTRWRLRSREAGQGLLPLLSPGSSRPQATAAPVRGTFASLGGGEIRTREGPR